MGSKGISPALCLVYTTLAEKGTIPCTQLAINPTLMHPQEQQERQHLGHMEWTWQTLYSQDAVTSGLKETSKINAAVCADVTIRSYSDKLTNATWETTAVAWLVSVRPEKEVCKTRTKSTGQTLLSMCGRVGFTFKQTGESLPLLQDCQWVPFLLAIQSTVCRFCPSDSTQTIFWCVKKTPLSPGYQIKIKTANMLSKEDKNPACCRAGVLWSCV